MVLPFIPATNLFFYVGFVVAERVLYIPSMGYCLLVALGFHLIDDRLRQKRIHRSGNKQHNAKEQLANGLQLIFRCACVLLLVVFSIRTIRRNQDWHSEETLYRSGIAVNPPKGK